MPPIPPPTSGAVSKSMKGNRGTNTNPELSLRRLLREAGFPGYRLHWKKAPGRPDIAYPGRRIAVFVHGCFWHRCPYCNPPLPKSHQEYWVKKFDLNRERDARKIRELEQSGWTVFVIWECQLKSDAEAALSPLLAALSVGSRGGSSPRP
ncbi:very short patch repair endonuclease [Parvivirga hydrogeniphila]|uniref:very short patch repair endonuclease n=1 Tax=Parvivirga hydrogeniphila TaxID=2939460 RepID=UPI002B27526A|nr:very short patch repair endonuclease [Parvivirga hydrogeniphila]